MRALFKLTIFVVAIAAAIAITCYECDSMHDPHCNEYFYAEGIPQVECDDAPMPEYMLKYHHRIPAAGCMTRIQEGVDGDRFFIRRSCFYGDLQSTAEACTVEDPYLPFTDILDCYVCDEDLCNTNGASGIASASLWAASLLLLLLLPAAGVF